MMTDAGLKGVYVYAARFVYLRVLQRAAAADDIDVFVQDKLLCFDINHVHSRAV